MFADGLRNWGRWIHISIFNYSVQLYTVETILQKYIHLRGPVRSSTPGINGAI